MIAKILCFDAGCIFGVLLMCILIVGRDEN